MRANDPDRFLISLAAKPQARPALWALYAFNYEIAKTREVVSDTTLGLIRLQWWRDALAAIYNGGGEEAPASDILAGLAAAIKDYDLPRAWFEELILAREFDLEDVPPETLEGLLKYAEFTNAPLMRLALQACGEAAEEDIVKSTACGYGLTGIIRSVPFHVKQRHCLLPAALMEAQGIDREALFAKNPGVPLQEIIASIAIEAKNLLKTKPHSKLLRAHRRIASLYLAQMESLDYDVFSSHMKMSPPLLHLRYLFLL